jgi:hypothetical protein
MKKYVKVGMVENISAYCIAFQELVFQVAVVLFLMENKITFQKLAVMFRMVCRHCERTNQPDKVQSLFPV